MLTHRTIYATFTNERDAERAAGALMDHGVSAPSISFVLPHEKPPIVAGTPHIPGVHRAVANDLPIPDTQTLAPPVTAAIDLNTGARVGEDVSVSRSAAGYRYDALGAEIPDTSPAVPPTAVPAAYVPPVDRYDPIPVNTPLRSHPDIPQTDILALPGNAPLDVVSDGRVHIVDQQRVETTAAHGITTTTGRDAAKGAAEGAGIGLGLGALLGLAAIAIPGVGWVAGAGALVAGLAAATGAAGAVAGGAYGFLADLGLPPHYTQHLQTHLESGGPVLSIHLQDGRPESELLALLTKYGATSAQAF